MGWPVQEMVDSAGAVRRVDAATVIGLRHEVLRPGQPLAAAAFPQDPEAVHLGAFDPAGRLVGCVTVFPEPLPDGRPDLLPPAAFPEAGGSPAAAGSPGTAAVLGAGGPAWRLRGMATRPEVRGAGHGRALLTAAIQAAREGGAALLWCNARENAVPFYTRAGFVPFGERFDLPGSGPHRRMALRLLPTVPVTG
jgi:GNAT superfamily N-acetyltransferase